MVVDDLVEGLAALMLPHDGVDREHLLEVAGECLLAPFDDAPLRYCGSSRTRRSGSSGADGRVPGR